MKSINRVTLLGAAGKDPEVRFTQEGLCISSFSLATSEKRKDKEEVTQWHNCVAFGKLGEIVEKYVVKGSKLYLEGTIVYQQYEKDGVTKYITKIVLSVLSLISSPADSKQKASDNSKAKSAPVADYLDDDIPF